ncbi:ABC-type xenobiotic transporter [Malassezia psittaci]|uniref:ABC-type xenobiotic transporter n=1 Tax=Malassezia psittaci TaxID=1821823 RepID=A0AAF0F5Q6_9BASI|nr:ABC-type xenobiotic transporter [Malassezia psittaci]
MQTYEAPFRKAQIIPHRSRLSGLLYLYSFAPPLPSLLRSPGAFFRHPVVLHVVGLVCATLAGAGLSSIDLLYGYWTNAVKTDQYSNPSHGQHRSDFLAWVNVVIGVFVFFTSWGFMLFLPLATHKLTHRLREEYFAAAIVQDPGFFDTHGPGEIASRANRDVTQIRAAFGEKLGFFVNAVATVVASMLMSFVRAPTVSGMLLLVLVFATVIMVILGSLGDMVTSNAFDIDSRLSTYVEQVLASVRVVHSFEITETLVDRMYALYFAPLTRFINQRCAIKGGDVASMYLVVNVLYSFGFWWGSIQIVHGHAKMDAVISCFYNYLSSMFSMAMVVPHLQSLIETGASIRKMRAVIERRPQIDVRSTDGSILGLAAGASNPENLPTYEPSFELDQVTFAYPARPCTASLKNVSIRFAPGKVTALVGPSGSGKSTITALLAREYDPTTSNLAEDQNKAQSVTSDEKSTARNANESQKNKQTSAANASNDLDIEAAQSRIHGQGQVLFGGTDVREINLRWLRSQIAVVRQNPQLFSGTIAENVAMGLFAFNSDTSIDQEWVRSKVQQALVKAEAWSFVKKLPKGMDTFLSGGRNVHLSGGQCQRIAIARAMIREPQILCLDEATSALDTSTEERIKRMLHREQVERGMTTIIVAHRLSTIQQADQIVTMNHGQVAEVGTHAELMQNKQGIYHTMVMHNRIASGLSTEEAERMDMELHPNASVDDTSRRSESERFTIAADTSKPPSASQNIMQFAPSGPNRPRRLSHTDVMVRGAYYDKKQWTSEPIDPGASQHGAKPTSTADASSSSEQDASKDTIRKTRFWNVMEGQQLLFVVGICFSLALAGSFPISGWISGYAIDALGIQNDPKLMRSTTNWWSMWFIVVAAIATVVGFFASFFLELASERMMNRIKVKSMHALLRQEVAFFDRKENGSGALSAAIFNHAQNIGTATGIVAVQLIMAGGNLVGALIMSLAMSWKLALTTVPGLISLLFASWFNVRNAERYEKIVQEPIDATASYIAEIIDALPTVASLGREFQTLRRMELESEVKQPYVGTLVWSTVTFAYSQFVLYGTTGLLLYWGTKLVMTRQISASENFAVFEGVFLGIFAAVRLSTFLPDIARARYASSVVQGWWTRQPQVLTKQSENLTWPPTQPRDLVLSNLELRYPQRPDIPALRDLSLTIHENQTVAFCGTSGSGKSSILGILQRFYDPSQGSITYAGNDLFAIPMQEWRAEMAYVSQSPVLYEGTLRWNLLLGAVDADQVTDADIESACREACVWDFAMALPDGLDTMIGLKGSSLSGGQRQRVCIARALLRRPKILLLDEATSALDAESEVLVQQALDNACKGCTTITIAHRLSTIRRADLICVVEDGRIVEKGAWEVL